MSSRSDKERKLKENVEKATEREYRAEKKKGYNPDKRKLREKWEKSAYDVDKNKLHEVWND